MNGLFEGFCSLFVTSFLTLPAFVPFPPVVSAHPWLAAPVSSYLVYDKYSPVRSLWHSIVPPYVAPAFFQFYSWGFCFTVSLDFVICVPGLAFCLRDPSPAHLPGSPSERPSTDVFPLSCPAFMSLSGPAPQRLHCPVPESLLPSATELQSDLSHPQLAFWLTFVSGSLSAAGLTPATGS